MDGLVAGKFDFKRKEITERRDKEFVSLQHDFNSRGMLNSGVFLKAAFEFLYKVAIEIIDVLLETYEQVEKTTNEDIVVAKSGEILDETVELAYREAHSAYDIIQDMTKKLGLPAIADLAFLSTNLANDSRKKAEILIETYKRRHAQSIPSTKQAPLQKEGALSIAKTGIQSIGCGILNKKECDQASFIAKHYKNENVFLDIPYQKTYSRREKALRHILKLAGLNPVIAKDKITSNDKLCKICRMIRTCKYGIADISLDRHSVSYELGLLHAFGLPTCILFQEGKDGRHFGDISGLEQQIYKKRGVGIKIKLCEWMEHNVSEGKKEPLKAFLEINESAEEQYIRFFTRLNDALKQKVQIHLSEPSGKCYHQIKTEIPGVHFEYGFHGRPRRNTFAIEIHIETKDRTYNILFLSELKKISAEVLGITGEPLLTDEKWMKRWTRAYLEKEGGEMTEQLYEWIVDNMEKFYKYLMPRLKKIHQKVKDDLKVFE